MDGLCFNRSFIVKFGKLLDVSTSTKDFGKFTDEDYHIDGRIIL